MTKLWLEPSIFDSHFGTRNIWGRDRPLLARDTPQPTNTQPDPAGGVLAYAFALQLHSRITTQRLGFRSGDEATALQAGGCDSRTLRPATPQPLKRCSRAAHPYHFLRSASLRIGGSQLPKSSSPGAGRAHSESPATASLKCATTNRCTRFMVGNVPWKPAAVRSARSRISQYPKSDGLTQTRRFVSRNLGIAPR